MPGILQTQQYAEQMIRIDDPDATAQQIERWVSIRMTRQHLLAQEQPPGLELLLDEATLRRAVGGRDVMRGQLQRLLAEAEKPNMDIRVLPFSAGEYPGPKSSFMLVKMPDPLPEVVSIDSAAGNVFLESENVTEFNTVYARLQDMCLDATDSIAVIAAVEKDLP